MASLRGLLGDPDCLRPDRIWWIAVIASIAFTAPAGNLTGRDAAVGMALMGVWWIVILGSLAAARRLGSTARSAWSPWITLLACVTAVTLAWLALVLAARLSSCEGVADVIWEVNRPWAPGSVLLLAGLLLVSQYRRTVVRRREESLALLSGLEQATAATLTAIARIEAEMATAKRDVARALEQADGALPVGASTGPIRENVRTASHRIYEIQPAAPRRRRSPLRRMAAWLDDLAGAPAWPVGPGVLLLLVIIGPQVLLTRTDALIVLATYACSGIVAVLVCEGLRRRGASMRRRSRRLALPGTVALCLVPATVLNFAATLQPSAVLVATIAAVPLATIIVLLPTMIESASANQEIEQRDLASRIAVAQRRAQLSAEQLRILRAAAVAELHGAAQGKAVAAETAAQLHAAGMSGADALAQRALEELEAWAHADAPSLTPAAIDTDPLADLVAPWIGLLVVEVQAAPSLDLQARMRVAPFVQDALVNAVKHGRARSAVVTVGLHDEQLEVVVRDDGIGPSGDGDGLARRRVRDEGGRWTLMRRPTGGAQVEITIPLAPIAAAP